MNRELIFSVTRNHFGYVLICWCMTLFLRVSYWGQVAEMNFCLINFDKFLSLRAESNVMKIHCPCITILGYTSQSRKFEKLINIHLNKKTLRRSSATHFQKQPPAGCSIKKAVLKNLTIFTTRKQLWWSLFLIKLQTLRPAILLKRDSDTGVFLWILQNL